MELRQRIIDSYIQNWKENGRGPETVYRFTRDLGISEREFFELFPTLDSVEDAFWKSLIHQVIQGIEGGAEFPSFTARQRFLTFGFGFLESALDHRSLLLTRLAPLSTTCRPPFLCGFEQEVKAFSSRVLQHGRETNEIADRGRLSGIYPQALYLLFRSLIQFNLKDRSPSFERSDAFWEKSVNLGFDLIRSQAIDTAFDLAKFLIPEPMTAK